MQPTHVELEIEALAAGGRGLARPGGRVWFVPGTVPGDLVLAEIRREHSHFIEGRLVRLLRPSPGRREVPCPVQDRCGGCPWMGLPDSEQGAWKHRLVVDALRRIGRFPDISVEALRAGTERLRYRNKIELSLGRGPAGEPLLGLHPREVGEGLVDVERCEVLRPEAQAVLTRLRSLLLRPGAAWAECFDRGPEHRVAIRATSGGILVALRESGRPFPAAEEFARELCARDPAPDGVVRLAGLAGRRGGARTIVLHGRAALEELFDGIRFELPAASFLQVNPEMAPVLLELVRAAVRPAAGMRLFDLYGGVGTFALPLARDGAAVTLCEADRDAVAAARRTARRARIRVRAVHEDVRAFVRRPELTEPKTRPDVVVANPPRIGLGPGVAGRLASLLRPSRVVLVSCDPATLARDARALAQAGMRLVRVTPVDLFPQTAQIESVALLERG